LTVLGRFFPYIFQDYKTSLIVAFIDFGVFSTFSAMFFNENAINGSTELFICTFVFSLTPPSQKNSFIFG
jgi:hypothetical protein